MSNIDQMLLLDTNAVLYLLQGDYNMLQLTDKKRTAINFVIEIELFGWPGIKENDLELFRSFMKQAYFFDYSHRIKEITIMLKQKYNLKIGDAFIAATAIYYELTLVSADKSFVRVKELQLISLTPSISK